jgi:hypothetical protein
VVSFTLDPAFESKIRTLMRPRSCGASIGSAPGALQPAVDVIDVIVSTQFH